MLPHPVTIYDYAPLLSLILFITTLLGFFLWVWDTNKDSFHIAELERECEKLSSACRDRILERNEARRCLEETTKEYNEAIRHGLELVVQLEQAKKGIAEARERASKSEYKFHFAERPLADACKTAQDISDLRNQLLNSMETTDGPTEGEAVPNPTIPAMPTYAKATSGDYTTSGPSYVQSIDAASKRYEDSLKTDRTA